MSHVLCPQPRSPFSCGTSRQPIRTHSLLILQARPDANKICGVIVGTTFQIRTHTRDVHPSSPVHRPHRRRPPPAHHGAFAGLRIPNNPGVSDTCRAHASSTPALDPSPARPSRKAIHSRQGNNYEPPRVDSALPFPKRSRAQQAERHAFRWRRQ